MFTQQHTLEGLKNPPLLGLAHKKTRTRVQRNTDKDDAKEKGGGGYREINKYTATARILSISVFRYHRPFVLFYSFLLLSCSSRKRQPPAVITNFERIFVVGYMGIFVVVFVGEMERRATCGTS